MKAMSVGLLRVLSGAMAASFFLFSLSCSAFALDGQERGDGNSGRVYVMSNASTGNAVIVFNRAADGTLTQGGEVATGGLGSGAGVLPPPLPASPGPDPLQSQDAMAMTEDGRFLLAVNAGSSEVSVMAVTGNGLKLVNKVSSGGVFPVSIAIHNRLVYVLNEGENPENIVGGIGNVTAFNLDDAGILHAIPNSTRTLGPDTGASDVLFSPDGRTLIATEMFTNKMDIFQIADDGTIKNASSISSNTPTPFGAAFGRNNVLAVTEIDVVTVDGRRQGVANASTTSSYQLTAPGTLQPVSKAIPTNRTGSCWIRFSKDGRFAYTGDTGAGTISIFQVSAGGELTLVNVANVGGAFSAPVDLDVTPSGRFLYVLSPFGLIQHTPPLLPLPSDPTGRIQGYHIERDGSLTPITTVGGIPFTVQGIVAR
jgi:6-phosphogluconolactonase